MYRYKLNTKNIPPMRGQKYINAMRKPTTHRWLMNIYIRCENLPLTGG
jgi:hypothetical protein